MLQQNQDSIQSSSQKQIVQDMIDITQSMVTNIWCWGKTIPNGVTLWGHEQSSRDTFYGFYLPFNLI